MIKRKYQNDRVSYWAYGIELAYGGKYHYTNNLCTRYITPGLRLQLKEMLLNDYKN